MHTLVSFFEQIYRIITSDPRIFALFLLMTGVFLVLFISTQILSSHFITRKRMKAVERRREQMRQAQLGLDNGHPMRARSQGRYPLLAKLADLLKLKSLINTKTIKSYLIRAGWHDPSALSVFLVAHLIAPLFLGMVTFMFTEGDTFALDGNTQIIAIAGGAIFGFSLPALLLKNAIIKREQKLEAQFPEALDLLLVCVEAGLSIEAAFLRVTDELTVTHPEVAEEMRMTSAELRFLGNRKRAYLNIAERVQTDSFKALSSSLAQSETWGVSIAQSLRTQSKESRDKRQAKIEEKGAALSSKLTVPLIAFIMPGLFAVLVAPPLIEALG